MPNTAADRAGDDALQVAVGVVRDAAGRILIAQRSVARHQGGYWEFPGGKIEPTESVGQALARELAEELDIQVTATRPLIRIPHDYPDRRVVLVVHEVLGYHGEPRGREGQPLRWVSAEALKVADFPAANRPIIAALQLPSHYVISPECTEPALWLAGLEQALARGERLIQFRVRGGEAESRHDLAATALARCHAKGARLMINGDAALAQRIGADGIHLTAAQLQDPPVLDGGSGGWVAAACHSPAELEAAAAIGVDFAVLSPVAATPSHPEADPLGWATFARWTAEATVPVYALGGMQPGDVGRAQAAGGQGVAGIRGFWL